MSLHDTLGNRSHVDISRHAQAIEVTLSDIGKASVHLRCTSYIDPILRRATQFETGNRVWQLIETQERSPTAIPKYVYNALVGKGCQSSAWQTLVSSLSSFLLQGRLKLSDHNLFPQRACIAPSRFPLSFCGIPLREILTAGTRYKPISSLRVHNNLKHGTHLRSRRNVLTIYCTEARLLLPLLSLYL